MTNLDELGFQHSRTFSLEQAMTVYATSGDLRWALIAAFAQSVSAAWSYGRSRVTKLVRGAVRRLAPLGPYDRECTYC